MAIGYAVEKIKDFAKRVHENGLKDALRTMGIEAPAGGMQKVMFGIPKGEDRWCPSVDLCLDFLFDETKTLRDIYMFGSKLFGINENTFCGKLDFITDLSGYQKYISDILKAVEKLEQPEETMEKEKEPIMPIRKDKETETINARIERASLSMKDGGLCYYLHLKMDGFEVCYGGRLIGKGYLGADAFEGHAKGTEAIMRIMDVVGVTNWEDLNGKYCRVVSRGWGETVEKIGNIIEDKWFDQETFFKEA